MRPFEKAREIRFGLSVDHIDFSAMTRTFVSFPLSGSVRGTLPEINISSETLTTRGNLVIDTFGGRVEIRNIRGSMPFSRLRKISMDVLLSDLDLENASRSLKFGQMGGIIEGRVSDLTFSFGQPERFELEIHSVRKRGVKQYVNADAVNTLSILSTGVGSGLSSTLLRFFEFFPYAKLGIYCKLENDVFVLRGTIHEKGVEYLIKKGRFRGIDVVNQNPKNRIRWKEMLKRLKTIGQGSAGVRVSIER